MNEILNSQIEALNISSFISEGEKYTSKNFPNLNISSLLNQAITGKVETNEVYERIFEIIGKEIISSIQILGIILAIIIIHSILKNISTNLKNESIAQVTYYVEYILIVTLIMTNFLEIISMIKETISSLVGCMNTLVPILLALMVTTGNIVTASFIEPMLLFIIIFIGNTVTLIFLPIVLLISTLGIVSNLSEKLQISKLTKFLKSSVTWILGGIVTIFVSILSLQGTLTSNIDGLTSKGAKATSSLIPIVGKALGDSVDTVLRMYFSSKKCSWFCRNDCINKYMYNTYIKINYFNNYISIYSGNL